MRDFGFDAVIFDLDGVITQTALVHSAAWKKMFDDYLKEREEKYGEPFIEFSHENDYLPFVDGKPRYKGVLSFLESRNINIPEGDPSDGSEMETICGIGNRKNIAFNAILEKDGVKVFDSTVELIHKLLQEGIHVGVASSSKNCKPVLEATGLIDLIETRVDGVVSAELGLKGKPEADIFTTASDNVGVSYDRAVVVEDAVSGVQAGKKGNFGLVLGIAREGNEKDLKINGADIVVNDIDEIGFEGIVNWFRDGLKKDAWKISYFDYVPDKEKSRETLLTIGNGYFGTRGAMEESDAGDCNYPGTYMAGVYNRLISKVADRDVENEDFVNVINWLPIKFKIDDQWLDANSCEIIDIQRTLHLNSGILFKKMILRDDRQRETLVVSERLASMDDPHMAAIRYAIKPLNYSERITVKTSLSGDHINAGVDRYKQLNQRHLMPLYEGGSLDRQMVEVITTRSGIKISAASRITLYLNDREISPVYSHQTGPARSDLLVDIDVESGQELSLHKIVAIFKSGADQNIDLINEAATRLEDYETFEDVRSGSILKWNDIWHKIDVKVSGDRIAQKLLRLHLYHLMVTTSPHNAAIDFGIPARGLHGEAYRGHIFWDELFIMPLYAMHFPESAKSVLMYRYRRLDEARKYAKEYKYEGAMFPWQSGSDGSEETQVLHLNPASGKWGEDFSSLQRHVSLAMAYNIWQYFWITNDIDFITSCGAEMYFEICRFWASKCELDPEKGRYSISEVMGPDEFHEKYKGVDKGGLKDNAYTNLMVAWVFDKAFRMMELLETESFEEIRNKIGLSKKEIGKWGDVMGQLNIVISDDGIISQYDGYFDLKELDWDAYRKKYKNIYRMDRILKAEGKSPDDYKVAKQADTLMTFYNLDKPDVDHIFEKLGYTLPENYLNDNLKYYLARTSHGSTLSRIVHAQLANMIDDKELSWKLYIDGLSSDFQDIQGGTTGEGIHAGVMAGTILIALFSYAGLNIKGEYVKFNPSLPTGWKEIKFRFLFKGDDYFCEVSNEKVRIKALINNGETVKIQFKESIFELVNNQWATYQ